MLRYSIICCRLYSVYIQQLHSGYFIFHMYVTYRIKMRPTPFAISAFSYCNSRRSCFVINYECGCGLRSVDVPPVASIAGAERINHRVAAQTSPGTVVTTCVVSKRAV